MAESFHCCCAAAGDTTTRKAATKTDRRRNFAVATFTLSCLLACGGPPRIAQNRTVGPILAPPPPPANIDRVFVLESGGPPSEDTVVTIAAGARRTIFIRRGAPDNSLFAVIEFPDSALVGGDSVRVSITPRPGLFGIDLEIGGSLARPASITMSYSLHFVAPAGALTRYSNDLGFERALFIGRVIADGRFEFLPTARPGSDLVRAVVTGPGRYLVAAPR